MEPTTSTDIQSELAYSIEIALLMRAFLQETWLGGQQQPPQLEQAAGDVQGSQEVSRQPQDGQDKAAEGNAS